ncbi:MAG: gamma-glutamyltransferase [Spirochaetaceae bacterium]
MKNLKYLCLPFLVVALFACSSDAPLADGSYTLLASGANENGWVPMLRIDVSDAEVSRAVYDLVNTHGDLLALQPAAQEQQSADYGDDISAILTRLSLQAEDDVREIPDVAAAPVLGSAYESLVEAFLERAEQGEAGTHMVTVDGFPEPVEAEELADYTGFSYRDVRTNLARSGSDTPSDTAGGFSVVASHRAAVEAGMEILRLGGTAADAAVTVAAMMSVVEPYFSSPLGGGTWLLYFDAETGTVTSYDGVGPTPMAAENSLFNADAADETADIGDQFVGSNGIHRSIVPGSWGAYMELLQRYGSLGLGDVLSPAIAAAEDGAVVADDWMRWLNLLEPLIQSWPDAAAIYAPDGNIVSAGDRVFNPDLGATYRALVSAWENARVRGERAALQAALDYYYRGPVAERIVAFSEENNGLFAIEDFSEFYDYGAVEPVSIDYRGLQVFQNPPSSQGMTELMVLRILEGYDFSDMRPNDADAVHLMSEAIKLAFADRNRYIADPNFVDVPVDTLLSREYADEQRARISLDSSLEWPIEDRVGIEGDPRNTTTFHMVDRYGNAAAVTTSIGVSFLVAGDTGIHMNERIIFMNSDPSDINHVEPGKKVRHTSGPHMVLRDGVPWIIGGNTGADFQPQGQVQQFISIVEFGLGAQEAVDLPRFEPQAFAATLRPWAIQNRLRLEPDGFSERVQAQLAERGQNVQSGGTIGAANMILIEDHATGDIEAAWESRESDSYGMVEMP